MTKDDSQTSDYQPVDCDFHDRLLAWATVGRPVNVTYVDEEGKRTSVDNATIRDVYTRDKAEYVTLANGMDIRLDQLVDVRDSSD